MKTLKIFIAGVMVVLAGLMARGQEGTQDQRELRQVHGYGYPVPPIYQSPPYTPYAYPQAPYPYPGNPGPCGAWTYCPRGGVASCTVNGPNCSATFIPYQSATCTGYNSYGYWGTWTYYCY